MGPMVAPVANSLAEEATDLAEDGGDTLMLTQTTK